MKKPFSLVKALKVGLTSLALAGSCLFASTTSAEHFSTRGTQIIDPAGNPVFFNGTNLGNWLVWEGYLMMGDFRYRTHDQLFGDITKALGGDWTKTAQFETAWRENYVTADTIDDLKAKGYNSVRVPFNFRLLWNVYENKFDYNGFRYIDNLVNYCRGKGMYILLDMHGTPGYQNPGDHSNNNDSNASHPMSSVHFLDNTSFNLNADSRVDWSIGANVALTAKIWKEIAYKYKDESVIWGYGLVNEPQTGRSEALWTAYKHIISNIRDVDGNHIIVVEGDNWGGYLDMFEGRPKLDPKLVIETHHYVRSNENPNAWDDIFQLDGRKALANRINTPIILGEFGEDHPYILTKIRDVAKANQYSGIFSWSFKKVSYDRSLWTLYPNDNTTSGRAFLDLRNAINSGIPLSQVYNGRSNLTGLVNFATYDVRNKTGSLTWSQSFYNDTASPVYTPTPAPTPTPTPSGGLSGTYKICSKGTLGWPNPKCLDVEEGQFKTGNGTPIQQWQYEGHKWQQWKIVPLGGDNYQIISVYSNKSMDLRGGVTADWGQSRPQLYDTVPNHPNQTWKIQYNASRGVHTIKSFVRNAAGLEIGLDVPGGSTANGEDLQFWTFYEGNPNQEWILTKLY